MSGALDEMVAKTVSRKQDKATRLTPVGTEKMAALPVVQAVFPNDLPTMYMAGETLGDVALTLRKQAIALVQVADAIDAMLAPETRRNPPDSPVDTARAERKEQERAADAAALERMAEGKPVPTVDREETFDDAFRAMQVAAQAATFRDDPGEATPIRSSKWECPEHGAQGLQPLESAKGRKYLACTLCTKFEK